MRKILVLLSVLALLLPAAPALAATGTLQAKASSWSRWSPGKKAYAKGVLTPSGLTSEVIPTATVKLTGKIGDYTRGKSCGYAVFRVTYQKSDGSLPFKHRTYRDCTYKTAVPYAFTDKNVYLVELKVCSEAKHTKVSLNCLYSRAWKIIYSAQ